MNETANTTNYLENVQVRVLDVKKSRSLVAKKSFAVGETILCEKPIISSQFAWNKFYRYRACDHCMEPLEDAQENVRRLTENKSLSLPYLKECCATNKSVHVRCAQCGIEYCSAACLQSAWDTYHQSMCLGKERENQEHPYNFLMSIWREMHLPPETTTIEIILRLLGQMKQQPDKETLLKKLRNFECSLVNEQEQIPHKLLNERYFSQLETIRELTYEYFKNHLYTKECEPWLSPEGFRSIFSLMGRNAQGIGTSPFSVWVENCSELKISDKAEKKKVNKLIDKIYDNLDRVAGSFLNAEGSGLYELQSMCNHSCKPNAEISFKNNNFMLTLVALEEIKPEEEICISYLDECQLHRSRHSRQKMLRENYLFTCECERCQAEAGQQPDVTSDEDDEEEEDEELETDDGSEEEETMED